jgi:hypothetical protein
MLLSLAFALVIYLPLLLCVVNVGLLPDESIQAMASQDPATVIALKAERFLVAAGWWLAVLPSMLSALQANLHEGSRPDASRRTLSAHADRCAGKCGDRDRRCRRPHHLSGG